MSAATLWSDRLILLGCPDGLLVGSAARSRTLEENGKPRAEHRNVTKPTRCGSRIGEWLNAKTRTGRLSSPELTRPHRRRRTQTRKRTHEKRRLWHAPHLLRSFIGDGDEGYGDG